MLANTAGPGQTEYPAAERKASPNGFGTGRMKSHSHSVDERCWYLNSSKLTAPEESRTTVPRWPSPPTEGMSSPDRVIFERPPPRATDERGDEAPRATMREATPSDRPDPRHRRHGLGFGCRQRSAIAGSLELRGFEACCSDAHTNQRCESLRIDHMAGDRLRWNPCPSRVHNRRCGEVD
jgi:hypothetical protein